MRNTAATSVLALIRFFFFTRLPPLVVYLRRSAAGNSSCPISKRFW